MENAKGTVTRLSTVGQKSLAGATCEVTCELVFKPKADILNICCDCQFVFFVLDELHVSHHA